MIPGTKVIVLVSRAAISAFPRTELEHLSKSVSSQMDTLVRYAFTEQGEPSLRSVLSELATSEVDEIAIVPLMMPVEASLLTWMRKSIARWQRGSAQAWPPIRLGPGLLSSRTDVQTMVAILAREALASPAIEVDMALRVEGAVVPSAQRHVFACHGAPCHNAGAPALWGHFRNELKRRGLLAGDGSVSAAKSTCLGPCALAPVYQVFPAGTYYCGVDERSLDRIIEEDLQAGKSVAELAYVPNGKKQVLRT